MICIWPGVGVNKVLFVNFPIRKILNHAKVLSNLYKIVDHSDVVGASPVDAALTASSFATVAASVKYEHDIQQVTSVLIILKKLGKEWNGEKWLSNPHPCPLWSSILLGMHVCVVSVKGDVTISMKDEDLLNVMLGKLNAQQVCDPFTIHCGAVITSWWHHQMETISALLGFCAGNSLVTGEFPSQRPVTWSFDVFFDLHLNKRFTKQSWGWWFEMPLRLLRRRCNVINFLQIPHKRNP